VYNLLGLTLQKIYHPGEGRHTKLDCFIFSGSSKSFYLLPDLSIRFPLGHPSIHPSIHPAAQESEKHWVPSNYKMRLNRHTVLWVRTKIGNRDKELNKQMVSHVLYDSAQVFKTFCFVLNPPPLFAECGRIRIGDLL
jgi:hypothetical protein